MPLDQTSSTEQAPAVDAVAELTPLQKAQRQDRMLLFALHHGHPVMYQQRQQFVHTLRFQQDGGSTVSAVYLTGLPEPVPVDEVSLDPNYRGEYSLRK